jgi:hypothetical protein
MRQLTAILLLPALGFLGCDTDAVGNDEGPSTFAQFDSAGIVIAVTPGAGIGPIGWDIDSLPDLVISSDDSLFLDGVQGLRALPDGGVLVVDAGSSELRFYDPEGRLVYRVGGKGEGPGEFMDPVLVPWPASDSILVADRRLPRLHLYSVDGGSHRTLRYSQGWPSGRLPPMGAVDPNALLFQKHAPNSVSGYGLQVTAGEHVLVDPETGHEVHLDSVRRNNGLRVRRSPMSYLVGIPFRPLPFAAATENGVLTSDGVGWDIREYDRQGTLRRILRVADHARRPVTEAMIDADPEIAWLDEVQLGSLRDELPIPDSLPVFESMIVDSRGWLWAQRYRPISCRTFPWNRHYVCGPGQYEADQVEPREWMVFDPQGQARGVVWTPPGLDVLSISDEHVLGVWRDELGLEYVQRYRIRRDGGAA